MKGSEITIKLPRFCSLSSRGVRLDDGKKHTIGERHAGTGVDGLGISCVCFISTIYPFPPKSTSRRLPSVLEKLSIEIQKKQSYVGNVM